MAKCGSIEEFNIIENPDNSNTDKIYKKYNLPKRDWENLYSNKIYRIKDRKELQTLNTK